MTTDQEIKEQAHLLKTITEITPGIITVVALPSREIVYSNRDHMTLLGFDAKEIINMSFAYRMSLFHPDDLALIQDFYQRFSSLRDNEENSIEYRLRNKEGNWVFLSLRSKVFKRDETGNVIQVIMIGQDITDKKKADNDVLRNKDLFEMVLNNTASSIMLLKPVRNKEGIIADFEYIFTNSQTLQSVSRETLTGKYFTEEFPGVKGSKLMQAYVKVMETGIDYQEEVDITPYGTQVWSQVYSRRTGDFLLVTYFDITEKKKAGQRILDLKDEVAKKVADKYYSLFNSIDEGFCIVQMLYDGKGKPVDWIYLESNPTFDRQVGSDPVGKKVSELVGTVEPFWYDFYNGVLQTRVPARTENYVASVDRWYRIYASPVGDTSDLLAIVFDNITERKRRQQHQEFLLKLSNALRTLTDAEEIQEIAARVLGEQIKASRAFYFIAEKLPQGNKYAHIITKEYCRHPHISSIVGRHLPPASYENLYSCLPEGKKLVIPDVNKLPASVPEFKKHYKEMGIQALIVVPLVKNNRYIAAFGVDDTEPRQWTVAEIAMVEETAELTWSAVERANAEAALRRSETVLADDLADSKHLQAVSSSLIEAENTDSIYEKILTALKAIMRSDMASLQILSTEKQALELAVWTGFHPESAKAWEWVEAGSGSVCAAALERNIRIVVPDVEKWDFIKNEEDLYPFRLSGIRAIQSTPLVSRFGKVVGMISSHWTYVHEPTERELGLLDVLARQTADLIERRKADEVLRKKEAHLIATFEALPVGIAVIDTKGKAVLSNKEMQRFLPSGQIPSRDKNNMWRWKADDRGKNPVAPQNFPSARALRGEAVVPGMEMLYRQENGDEIWTRVASVPVKDKNGNVVEVVSVVTDISDMKRVTESLRESEQRLKDMNENLERMVEDRTRELISLKLKQEKEKLNAVIFAQEQERSRISEGLHNGVAQLLYAAQSRLQLLSPQKNTDTENFILAGRILTDAINETRKISFELMPPVLKDYGLETGLRTLVNRIFSGATTVKMNVSLQHRLHNELEISIYRIVQEILNNVLKHARATEVLLDVRESEKEIIVKVADNGIGFSVSEVRKKRNGMGLETIRNRIKLLEGSIRYHSKSSGTSVVIRIPLVDSDAEK